MAGLRVHIVMDAEMVARIDLLRSDGVSRGEWVRRAVEAFLEAVEVHASTARVHENLRAAERALVSGEPTAAPSMPSPAPAEQPVSRSEMFKNRRPPK